MDVYEQLEKISETKNTILDLFDGWNINEVELMLEEILTEVRRRSIYRSK